MGNRNISFRGKDIVLTSVAGSHGTLINCERQGRGFWISQHETPAAVIRGVTIENGVAPSAPSEAGGGILFWNSSATVRNCRIINCSADGVGGGVCLLFSNAVMDSCTIAGNMSGPGGGIYLDYQLDPVRFSNCVITGNWGTDGGGVCSTIGAVRTFTNCTITANLATTVGGILADDPIRLDRCIVRGNCAINDHPNAVMTQSDLSCCDIDIAGSYLADSRLTQCIDVDPAFCYPANCWVTVQGDWSLQSGSPCLPEQSPCQELIGALEGSCANPTNPMGACCYTGAYCVVEQQSECERYHGVYQGDHTNCSPNPCLPPTGACCGLGGICIVTMQSDCAPPGRWLGRGTTCAPNPCLPSSSVDASLHGAPPAFVAALPNPSAGATSIQYGLAATTSVAVEIIDPRGVAVRHFWEGPKGSGTHAIRWDGRDDAGNPVASGVYLARVQTAGGVAGCKAVLAR